MTNPKKFRSFLSASLLLAASSVLLLLFLINLKPALAQSGGKNAAGENAKLNLMNPVVGTAVRSGASRPARELPGRDLDTVDPGAVRQAREINKLNTSFNRRPRADAPVQKDGALQASWTPREGFQLSIPGPSLTFEGIPVQNSAPPDTTGTAGPNDYVQTVNSTLIRVWDKATGVPKGPAFSMSSLFAAVGGVCATNNQGDPIVIYDRMADRWLLSQFAFANQAAPPYHQCIAISKTGDPLGAYWAYDFITPGAEFPDYPKFGVWPDAYYYSDRQFTAPALSYNGFGVFAFERAKMLVGDPTASFVYFNAGPGLSDASSGILPTDFNGLTPPPAGAPNLFSVFTDDAYGGPETDALRLFDFCSGFPGSSCVGAPTFPERGESPLAVLSFDSRDPVTPPSPFRNDIEQPAPATAADYLDSIGDRLMLRLFYINRAGTEMVTTVHTVNAGVIPGPGLDPTIAQYEAGTRYYVLQKTTPAGAWSVLDQATYSPDTVERWMGSSALDNAGNLAVGYSASNASTFPSLRYAGRLLGDPPNTLAQGEATMFAGTGVQRGTSNRWGDYSNMSLDPTDDCTFWYTNEYYTSTTLQFNWQTRIGSFNLGAGTCTAPAQGTLSGTITACDTGVPLNDALVQVSGGPSAGFSAATKPDGTYSFKLAPGTYSVTISDPAHDCNPIGPFTAVITNGATTIRNGCLTGDAKFVLSSTAISGGDGDGAIDSNECNNLNVTILNDGCLIGSSVTAVLSSTTPGVSIVQPNSAYPNTPEEGTATNTTPFSVSTSNSFVCGTEIDFTLTVNFAGGSSVLTFSLPTCGLPTQMVSGSLAAGDTTQDGRLGRNGVTSNCGTAKTCPGIFGAGAPRRYDTHNFVNGPSPACATITTTTGCTAAANQIIPVAYLGSYNPANICQNYLGDPGGSGASTTFEVDVPANGTLVVVVQEATSLGGCAGYTVAVDGLVANSFGNGFCGAPTSVVSRKIHGGQGPFDIDLPLVGTPGLESRGAGGASDNEQLVFTFPDVVTFTSASVTQGTGSVSSATGSGTTQVTVNLTGVTNAQTIQVTLVGVGPNSPLGSIDAVENHPRDPTVAVRMRVLVGDSGVSGSVNATDIGQTKSRVGQLPLTATNFRSDVNANGAINSTDVGIVKARSGTSVPP
jgi:hypothetical protein